MTYGSFVRTLTLAVVAIPGCSSSSPNTQQIPVLSDVHAGHFVSGHEVRSFRACGTDLEIWATDASNTLWRTYEGLAYNQEPYEALFAIVRGTLGAAPLDGFGESYPGQISVSEVLYVAQEGHDCSLDVSEFWARGAGNEPFWSFLISTTGIAFASLDGTALEWNDTRIEMLGDTIRFEAEADSRILVDVSPVTCYDTMSGAMYGYTTNVQLDDATFSGCAIRGAGAPPS